LTLTFFLRGALAPFSHPLFTSMTGIGLGLARQTRNLGVKLITPVVGLIMAICMHSIWNGSAALFGGGVFLLTYFLLMVPEFLMCDLQRGFLTQDEYKQLGSIHGRMGSSFNALTQSGVKGWRARMKFNQLASELAFHRCRVARGLHSTSTDVAQIEEAYLHLLQTAANEVSAR